MRHYHRIGKSGSPLFGKGAWLPDWERRKFGTEMIDEAQKHGATDLITEFYKGFGRKIEEEQWPRLTEFVGRCHERGIKVWVYTQMCSLYYETFGAEVEDWESWTAKNRDGSTRNFGKAYFRCAPCLNSPGYAAYMTNLITDGAAAIGFDGVHLDNAYYEHCWCPRCADLFRKYLASAAILKRSSGFRFRGMSSPLLFHQRVPRDSIRSRSSGSTSAWMSGSDF